MDPNFREVDLMIAFCITGHLFSKICSEKKYDYKYLYLLVIISQLI